MDLGFIFLAVALTGLVIFLVAQPFIDPARLRQRAAGPDEQLTQERDTILNAVRDLDFDYATGKLTDEDYAAQRAALMARGAAVLKQLDAAGAAAGASPIEQAIAARRKTATGAVEGGPSIEQAIAARRKTAASAVPATGLNCPGCGAGVGAGDRFCPDCGAALNRRCDQCSAPLAVGDKFCGKCGAPVALEAQP